MSEQPSLEDAARLLRAKAVRPKCSHHAAAIRLAVALRDLVDWAADGEWIELPEPLSKAAAEVDLARATGLLP